MKQTPAQVRALTLLRAAPDHKINSKNGPRGIRVTVEALARRGLVELERTSVNRVRRHRDGTTTAYTVITSWEAELVPERPGDEALAELDLIIKNREGVLRPDQRKQAAAYVAHTAPAVALKNSPAASEAYSVCRAYRDALTWPVAHLLDQVMMLRHMTGQCPLPGGIPGQSSGERTDVWVLTANATGPRPGRELGRVRASTQNAAALRGNSLLNTRGTYQMRRREQGEVGHWREDFRAHGLVLRLEAVPGEEGFRISQVADGRTLVIRPTAEEAKRDALADLTSLSTALTTSPIHAD